MGTLIISEDDCPFDEEEQTRNFDLEAKLIIGKETLPKKSGPRYEQVYAAYKKWLVKNAVFLSESHENNLVIYFQELKGKKLSPPTLWSVWSMLRSTLFTKESIDIKPFYNLKSILKAYSKGYKSEKAKVFSWSEVERFLKEADDHEYLAYKVMLAIGISGALRCDELYKLKKQDVQDLGSQRYLISINESKNDYDTGAITESRQLIVGPIFYNYLKKYIDLRPSPDFTDNFFIRYQQGQCAKQHIGINKIYEIPSLIAKKLNLENPEKYKGHSFRRTGPTLLANSGANFTQVKQLGGWRSDKVAQGYVENSLCNREQIFNGVTSEAKKTNNTPSTTLLSRPSTSVAITSAPSATVTSGNLGKTLTNTIATSAPSATITSGALDKPSTSAIDTPVLSVNMSGESFELDPNDFSTELEMDDLDFAPVLFKTANKKPLKELGTTASTIIKEKFLMKPPVKLHFNKRSLQGAQAKHLAPVTLQFNKSSVPVSDPPPNKKAKTDCLENVASNGYQESEANTDNQGAFGEENNNTGFKNSFIKYEDCVFHSSITNNFYSYNKN